jgi:hypothetical protein
LGRRWGVGVVCRCLVALAGWLLLLGWLVGVVMLLLGRGVRVSNSKGVDECEPPWAVTVVVDADMVVNGWAQASTAQATRGDGKDKETGYFKIQTLRCRYNTKHGYTACFNVTLPVPSQHDQHPTFFRPLCERNRDSVEKRRHRAGMAHPRTIPTSPTASVVEAEKHCPPPVAGGTGSWAG